MEKLLSTLAASILNPEKKSTLNTNLQPKLSQLTVTVSEKVEAATPRQYPVAATAMADDQVRVLTMADCKEAAKCLDEAFWEDKVARYFIDVSDRPHWTETHRKALNLAMMEYVVAAHIMKGLALTVGPNYACVALWMPPGQNMDDLVTIIRSGMWRLNYKLSPEGKARFFKEFLPLLHHTKEEVLGQRDADSWYLVYLGTRPGAQGRGWGKKIVEYVTQQADREGRPCYVESSSERNLTFYLRQGFEHVRQIHLHRASEGEVPLWIMVREPQDSKLMLQQ